MLSRRSRRLRVMAVRGKKRACARSVPDGEAIDALGFPAIQPERDGFRMARTQQAFAGHDGRRYARRDEQ
jgi:hypothetical protein